MLKFFRFFILYIWFFIGSILGLIFVLIRPFHPDNCRKAGKFLSPFSKFIFNIDVEWRGEEKIPSEGSIVYLSNHQSNLDVLIVSNNLPPRVVGLGKKQLMYIPIFGPLFVLAGNILIDRSNRKKAFESIEKAKKRLIENNMSVWIMPEGTRSNGRGLLPFKKGAFHLAMQTKIPIIPVVVTEYHKTLSLNKWFGGKVIIKYLDQISTENLTKENMQDFMDNIREIMKNELDTLNQEAIAYY